MPKVLLQSSDKLDFSVDMEVAKMSKTVKTMLDDWNAGAAAERNENCVIPLPNIKGDILLKVINWIVHHQKDPILDDEDETDIRKKRGVNLYSISPWDQNFLNVEQPMLFGLIQAAIYLDIKGLLDITCKSVANEIREKSPEQLRVLLGITKDFIPDEEDRK